MASASSAAPTMRVEQAIELIAPGFPDPETPAVWADLGCGRGTFTLALAHRLADGSTIHAVDTNPSALRALPHRRDGVIIRPWCRSFLDQPWPFDALDGVLMANSLHYVADQPAFVRRCVSHMKPRHAFLIVEYDLAEASVWVPYPIGRRALTALFAGAGYSPVTMLGSRRSAYHRGDIYAAMVTGGDAGA